MSSNPFRKPVEHVVEEMNLVEWPLGLLCDQRRPGENTIVCSDSHWDAATGRYIQRRVTVTGGDAWGLPTSQDVDVLLALMKLTNARNGFSERMLRLSLYEIRCSLLWPSDGRYKRRLREAMLRLFGVSIAYDNAWRSNGKWKSLTAFHLLDNLALTNTLSNFDPDEEQYIKWNDNIVESMQSRHTKSLDWKFYLSLRLPTTKRIYRFLDKRFNLGPEWTFNVEELAKEKLGMSRNSPVWECRRQLAKSFEELESRGFLAVEKNRFERVGKGSFVVHLRDAVRRKGRVAEQPMDAPPKGTLAQELWKRGMTNGVQLAASFAEEHIRTQITNFDHRRSKGERLTAGWLRRAIEAPGGYSFRKGYKSDSQRQAEATATAERVRQQAVREDIRRDRDVAFRREKAEQSRRVDLYVGRLADDERINLEQRALEAASEALRHSYFFAKKSNLVRYLAEARYEMLFAYLNDSGLLPQEGEKDRADSSREEKN
jgi:hypothetical protein